MIVAYHVVPNQSKAFSLSSQKNNKGKTTNFIRLHQYVENNDIKKVKQLFEKNKYTNINVENDNMETALHIAAKNKNIPMLKVLINLGANVYCIDINGNTVQDILEASNLDISISNIVENLYKKQISSLNAIIYSSLEKENFDLVEDLLDIISSYVIEYDGSYLADQEKSLIGEYYLEEGANSGECCQIL